MGKFTAFIGFMGIFIYFLVFIIVASAVDSDSSDIGNFIDYEEFNLEGLCQRGRNIPELDGFLFNIPETSISCDRTRGAIDEDICNELVGCYWNTTTTFLWWGGTEKCFGSLDFDYYDDLNEWDSYNSFIRTLRTQSVCELSGVRNNQTNCYYLGCGWIDGADIEDNMTDSISLGKILKTTGSLFSFRYNFNLPLIFNVIAIIFLFYLPILFMIGCIYFMLPFLH